MSKEPKTLNELFHDTLKDIYFAEKKILSTLPKMAKAAENEELKAAFEKHQAETEDQVQRLEEVFEQIEKKPQGKTCAAIVGITDEGAEDYQGVQELTGAGRWSSCSGPGSGALRDLALRYPYCVGRGAGARASRAAAAGDT